MCEKTIESALDAKGIIAAEFDLEKNIATVTYKPAKISEEQIHKLITARGYDTDKFKATDEEYSRTHDCCKYREQEKH
jgi:copper chaperone CopZ